MEGETPDWCIREPKCELDNLYIGIKFGYIAIFRQEGLRYTHRDHNTCVYIFDLLRIGIQFGFINLDTYLCVYLRRPIFFFSFKVFKNMQNELGNARMKNIQRKNSITKKRMEKRETNPCK